MKKIFVGLMLILAVFSFTSCDLLLAILGGLVQVEYADFEADEIENPSHKDCFVVGYNTSSDFLIEDYNSFYVDDNDSTYSNYRSASEEEVYPEDDAIVQANLPESKLDYAFTDNKLKNEISGFASSRTARAGSYPATKNTVTAKVGDKKDFFIFTSSKSGAFKTAECMKVGSKCVVWYIDNWNKNKINVTDYTALDFSSIAAKFDTFCAIEEEIFGSHIYSTKVDEEFIDPTDKINIVIQDIYGDSNSTQNGGTFGYFRPMDLVQRTAGSSYESSNEGQIINIDSYFYKLVPEMVYSTLVHEYCHLLNFCNKSVKQGVSMDTWYTEMMAMTAEDMLQGVLGIDNSQSPKERIYEVIDAGGTAFGSGFIYNYNMGPIYWPDNTYVYCSYANAFALGAYLVRNFGGFDLLKQIATNGYGNEASITAALKACNQKYYTNSSKSSTAYCDFDYVIKNEYYILMNNSSSTSTNVLSLNKPKITYSGNSNVYFSPIDIYEFKYTDSKGDAKSVKTTPRINTDYKDGLDTKDSRVKIGPKGFDVQVVGTTSRFTVNRPVYDCFEYTVYYDSNSNGVSLKY